MTRDDRTLERSGKIIDCAENVVLLTELRAIVSAHRVATGNSILDPEADRFEPRNRPKGVSPSGSFFPILFLHLITIMIKGLGVWLGRLWGGGSRAIAVHPTQL